ncbi:MAG TPA: MBL fold metallo-hydrolase [Gemmatimonadaceae bacterium]|nr:MBL fold metallo-hydrolase [Gemmatimonadaceae bacterium]
MRSLVLSSLLVPAAIAAAQQRPALFDDAVRAMGGESAIRAATSLTIEGTGRNYNFGQGMSPGVPLPRFDVSELRRSTDLTAVRHRHEVTRTAAFTTASTAPQRIVFGLDGDIAYGVPPNGNAARSVATVVPGRRQEHYHHPLVLIRAALEPGAEIQAAGTQAGNHVLRVKLSPSDSFQLWLDRQTHLPSRIRSVRYDVNLGDAAYETRFSHWAASGGSLQLPTRLSSTFGGATIAEYEVTRNVVGVEPIDLAAPEAARGPAPAPTVNVTSEELAPGVWYLAGGSHHSVLVEFDQYLMLIETPQHDARTLAVIAKARELRPGKPLRYAVNTHHHHDHSGGVRAAISEGLTIVTHSGNVAFYRDVARRSHTLQPDALARAPRSPTIVAVGEKRVFQDRSRTVELYHVRGSPHTSTMIVAYLPTERMLVQADAYNPPAPNAPPPPSFPFAKNLVENVERLGLRVDRVAALHGRVVPFSEIRAASQ